MKVRVNENITAPEEEGWRGAHGKKEKPVGKFLNKKINLTQTKRARNAEKLRKKLSRTGRQGRSAIK